MRPKNPLFKKCIDYLESLPNIKATIQGEPYFSSEVLADGELIIGTSNKTANYVCEIKTGITNDIVEQVAEYFANLGKRLNGKQRPLLITRNLSSLVINKLLERNIEFIDVDGNIYLNSSEIYIAVRNQTSKENINKSLEITALVLQVIYFILKDPSIIANDGSSGNYEKIHCILGCGITTKTLKNTLEKLEKLDYLKRTRKGYEIIDYVKLFERWELGYAERLHSKLLIGKFRYVGSRNFSDIEDGIKLCASKYGYLIGGELAASIMTQYIRPVGAILHIPKHYPHLPLAVILKLKPDPDGNIEIHERFDGQNDHPDPNENLNNLINPLLIHAELVRTGDSRLKETAQLIFDKYIEEIAQR
ncbi:MAG: type IV toxin-antitoxin system AbiEi family antitoxin [Pseudanabaena sp. ELA645]|jgi:hypothetical protein